jgi:hypothetical protein
LKVNHQKYFFWQIVNYLQLSTTFSAKAFGKTIKIPIVTIIKEFINGQVWLGQTGFDKLMIFPFQNLGYDK